MQRAADRFWKLYLPDVHGPMQPTATAFQCSPWHPGSRGGPTGLPASSTAEPGCPLSTTLLPSGLHLALLSRNSSPQADPSSRNTTPTPKTSFTCQLTRHFPGGFPDCPLPVLPQNLHALPISRFVTLAKALQAAFPLHACSPKKLTCRIPVCLPCFSPGLALSRPSTKSL